MLIKILSVILGILMIAAGIWCMTLPDASYSLVPILVGVAIVAAGIGYIVVYARRKKQGISDSLTLVCGILTVLLGVFILCDDIMQWSIELAIPTFVAAWLLVTGIFRTIDSFAIKDMAANAAKMPGNDPIAVRVRVVGRAVGNKWWLNLILGILMIVLGFLSVLNPITTALTVGVLLGISIVISGINLILVALAVG